MFIFMSTYYVCTPDDRVTFMSNYAPRVCAYCAVDYALVCQYLWFACYRQNVAEEDRRV
jgi:hypothetical protein